MERYCSDCAYSRLKADRLGPGSFDWSVECAKGHDLMVSFGCPDFREIGDDKEERKQYPGIPDEQTDRYRKG